MQSSVSFIAPMVAIIVKCHIDTKLCLSFIAPMVAIIVKCPIDTKLSLSPMVATIALIQSRLSLSLLAPTDAPLAITGCHDVPEQGDRPTLHCDVPPELAGHRSPHLHYHPGDARPNHSGLLCVQLCHELHHSRTVPVLPCHGSQRQ